MSANAYRPHLIVLVEDDAARQIVNGFILHPNLNTRAIQVMRPLGGWRRILDTYREEYLSSMYIFRKEGLRSSSTATMINIGCSELPEKYLEI